MFEPAGLQRDHRTMRPVTSAPAGCLRRRPAAGDDEVRPAALEAPVRSWRADARPAGCQVRASLSVVGALTAIPSALTRPEGSPAAQPQKRQFRLDLLQDRDVPEGLIVLLGAPQPSIVSRGWKAEAVKTAGMVGIPSHPAVHRLGDRPILRNMFGLRASG